MIDKINFSEIYRIYFEELNSGATYEENFPDPVLCKEFQEKYVDTENKLNHSFKGLYCRQHKLILAGNQM